MKNAFTFAGRIIVLLALAIAPVAGAASKSKKHDPGTDPAAAHKPAGETVTGEIVSIGVDKAVIVGNKGAETPYVINVETKFGKDMALSLSDFEKGDKVLITFIKKDGHLVARQIENVGAVSKHRVRKAGRPGHAH